MHQPLFYYKDKLHQIDKQLKTTEKMLRFIAAGRLIVFSGIFFLIIIHKQINLYLNLGFIIFLAFIFGALVIKYFSLSEKKRYIEELIKIYQGEISVLEYSYSERDTGSDFNDMQHPFSFDLDIFGEGSLFQFINRTVTKKGRELLARWLTEPLLNHEQINQRQGAIKELGRKDTLRYKFIATGKLFTYRPESYNEIQLWLDEPLIMLKSWFYRMAVILFPLLSGACIVLTIFIPSFYRLLILVFLLQLIIVAIKLRHTNRIHSILSKELQTFRKMYRLLDCIEGERFSSEVLCNLNKKALTSESSAKKAIHRLSKILQAFDNRLNMLAGILLNGFFLWDIQCVLRLDKWKTQYREFFPDWVESISSFDALISLATFHFNFPDYCFPQLTDHSFLQTKELGHPLIPDAKRVCNDFSIPGKGKITIITGANMAGKSTFLRTAGINMILAMAGAPVCAQSFIFTPVEVFTSMRVSDSLYHNESYFYVELKRLKAIIDSLSVHKRLFVIIDEMLKGTNSVDKHNGSMAVVRRLYELGGTAIIATHDLDLARQCEQQYDGNIINKCFEVEIHGTEISFDYRLKDGITEKMNASLLMHQMGIA